MLNNGAEAERRMIKKRRPDLYKLLLKVGAKFLRLKSVRLDEVKIDQGIYPREETDWDKVEIYAQAMENGDEFPPLLVASDPENLLIDGNHRYNAAKRFGAEYCWVEEWDIPKPYVKLIAQAANTEAGNIDTPLTGREKKKAIIQDWQDGIRDLELIASALKTSVSYVKKVLSKAGLLRSEKERMKERAKELREQGLSYREIAKKLEEEFGERINPTTIMRWFEENVANITQVTNATPQPTDTEPASVRDVLDDPEKLIEEEEREIASAEDDDVPEILKKIESDPKLKAQAIRQIKKAEERERKKKEVRLKEPEEIIAKIWEKLYDPLAEYQVRFCEGIGQEDFRLEDMLAFIDEIKRFYTSGEYLRNRDYLRWLGLWRARKSEGYRPI